VKPLVYVIGPYQNGNHLRNTKIAMDAGDFVISQGGLPVIPHLSHFHDAHSPKPREYWLEWGLALLKTCQYAVRIPGYSEGGDTEQAQAARDGKTVYQLVHAGYNIITNRYKFEFMNPNRKFEWR